MGDLEKPVEALVNIDLTRPIQGAPHISWDELTTTEHRNFLEANKAVGSELQDSGETLACMLETIRSYWGRPLIVHSGYRCPPLNTAIGGSATSQHMKFEAADFHIAGVSLMEVFHKIRASTLQYGQLALEGVDPAAGLASWVHVSLGTPWRKPEDCLQVLYYSTRTRKYTRLPSSMNLA